MVIADDDALIRTRQRAIIEAEPDLTVAGEAADGAEVVPLVRRLRPDLVLMDVRMPAVDGIQATRHLVETFPGPPKVLVVTTFENDDHVYDALRVGASGVLLKRPGRPSSSRPSGPSSPASRCCSRRPSGAWPPAAPRARRPPAWRTPS